MKLLIKNLHNQSFTVECEEDDTIKVLKEKIAAKDDLPDKYDPELLKLLYTGKVMDDDETVEHYAVKTDGFLVLVKQTPGKPKPPPKKKPNQGFNNHMGGFGSNSFMQPFQQNPFGANAFQQNPFGANAFQNNSFGQNAFSQPGFGSSAFNQNQFVPPPQPQIPSTGAAGGFSADPLPNTKEREESLNSLVTMGFDRDDSEKALRASSYNVDIALDYLTSGNIPAVADKPPAPQLPGLGTSTGGVTGQGRAPSPPASRGGGMGANLQQMRQLLQDHPEQLQVIKEKLKDEHPEIAQMIENDPKGFLELLNQADAGGDDDRPAVGAGGAGGTGGTGGHGQGAVTVTLSPNEQQIITRLQDMGFERNRVIEAFLACDRNENLAVEYLLTGYD